MQAVSVASRQLLVLEPFVITDTLMTALQAAGWAVQRCTAGELNARGGDALLLYLDRQPGQMLREQLRRTGLACDALADAGWLQQVDELQLSAWLFRILPAAVDHWLLLEVLQQAERAKPWLVDSASPPRQKHNDAPVTLEDYILRAELQALNDVLGRYRNMSQAARTLGVSRPTLYRLLHKHRLR